MHGTGLRAVGVMSGYSSLENRALRMVAEAGGEGILQSELWKRLGASSREGSRLALRFERRGLIERKKVLHEGRWTYRLTSKRREISLKSIADCPCFLCEDMERCYEGGDISPISCEKLTEWILLRAKKAEAKNS